MAKDKKKDKEIKLLEDKIQEITSEKDKYLDIAQRAQADLVNYRKKVSQDNKELEDKSQRKIFMQIINVLDQINLALEYESEFLISSVIYLNDTNGTLRR